MFRYIQIIFRIFLSILNKFKYFSKFLNIQFHSYWKDLFDRRNIIKNNKILLCIYINIYTIIKLIIDKTPNLKTRENSKIINNSNFPFSQDYPNTKIILKLIKIENDIRFLHNYRFVFFSNFSEKETTIRFIRYRIENPCNAYVHATLYWITLTRFHAYRIDVYEVWSRKTKGWVYRHVPIIDRLLKFSLWRWEWH